MKESTIRDKWKGIIVLQWCYQRDHWPSIWQSFVTSLSKHCSINPFQDTKALPHIYDHHHASTLCNKSLVEILSINHCYVSPRCIDLFLWSLNRSCPSSSYLMDRANLSVHWRFMWGYIETSNLTNRLICVLNILDTNFYIAYLLLDIGPSSWKHLDGPQLCLIAIAVSFSSFWWVILFMEKRKSCGFLSTRSSFGFYGAKEVEEFLGILSLPLINSWI